MSLDRIDLAACGTQSNVAHSSNCATSKMYVTPTAAPEHKFLNLFNDCATAPLPFEVAQRGCRKPSAPLRHLPIYRGGGARGALGINVAQTKWWREPEPRFVGLPHPHFAKRPGQ